MSEAISITVSNPFDWRETIPWALVVVGWLIVDVQQRARDRLANAEAAVARVKEDLRKLERLAIEYHLSSEPTTHDSLAIKSLLRCVSFEINNKSMLLQNDKGDLSAVRQAITLENFDTSDHQAQVLSSPIIQGIGCAIENLEEAIERRLSCFG